LAALLTSRPKEARPLLAYRVEIDHGVRLQPHRAIAHVGEFDHQVLADLALQRNVPLIDSRRTAAARIFVRAWAVDLPGGWPDARIERRRVEIGGVVVQSILESERRLAEGRIGELQRVEAGAERSAQLIVDDGGGSIDKTPTRAQHRLRRDLIGHAESRTNRIGIGIRKVTIAAFRTVAFILRGAKETARRRVRRQRSKL